MEFVVAARAGVGELLYLFRYIVEETDVVDVGAPALLALLDPVAEDVAPVEDEASADAWMIIEASLASLAAASDGGGQLLSAARSAAAAADLLGLNAAELDTAADTGEIAAVRRALADLLARRRVPGGVPHPSADGAARRGGPAEMGVDRPTPPEVDPAKVSFRTLKVDQEKVDRLVDLVGELIVAKNSLPFLASAAEEEWGARVLSRRIKDQYAVLNRIAEDLRDGVMGIRMLPFSVAFARFPRMVRDLGRRLGKQVDLVCDGEDTAADKDIIESLGDPLVHLVRNCLDHGVETAADRVAAGKAPQSTVRLAAMPDGDAVLVEVGDDGRGIDPVKVRHRAYERGLIGEEEAEALSDAEAVDLVFRPGFSTMTEVSDLSGRGVGMDAVRSRVEQLGGPRPCGRSRGRARRSVCAFRCRWP